MQAPDVWAPPRAGLIDWGTSCPNIGWWMSRVVCGRRPRRRAGLGCPPPNKGLRFPADPPTVEEIILVMREAGPGPYADRTRGLFGCRSHGCFSRNPLVSRSRSAVVGAYAFLRCVVRRAECAVATMQQPNSWAAPPRAVDQDFGMKPIVPSFSRVNQCR
jgi:hypothetical protein